MSFLAVVALIGGLHVVLGGLFVLTGALGVARFPDVYTRLHAAGVADTMGAATILVGLALVALANDGAGPDLGVALVVLKLAAILFFMWVSGPTACHALAKAAWLAGVPPWQAPGEAEAAPPPAVASASRDDAAPPFSPAASAALRAEFQTREPRNPPSSTPEAEADVPVDHGADEDEAPAAAGLDADFGLDDDEIAPTTVEGLGMPSLPGRRGGGPSKA